MWLFVRNTHARPFNKPNHHLSLFRLLGCLIRTAGSVVTHSHLSFSLSFRLVSRIAFSLHLCGHCLAVLVVEAMHLSLSPFPLSLAHVLLVRTNGGSMLRVAALR